jgi:glycosyltransferase involved in cell wall biosynthesis
MSDSNNKSVAIVVCAWPPQGGGIGNNAYYHLRELKKLGYSVKAFTPKYKDTVVSGDDVEFLSPILPIGKAGFLFSLWQKLKSYDIIHLYYPFFGTDIIIFLFKLFHRHKKLVMHYEMDPVGTGLHKLAFKLHMLIVFPFMVMVSDRIGVLSWDNASGGYLKKYLDKYRNKFVELPNAIDTSIFKPEKRNNELAKKYNIDVSDQVVVFVGGLDDQHFFKGVEVLLPAFSNVSGQLSQSKLMIIGDGNRREGYEALAKKLNIDERVVFTGWVKNEDLPDYYNLGSLFVLPSTEKTESFGIVTAEAQACGLPAIVSNWPGSRTTIDDKKTGLLVEPKNINDLSEKLLQALTDNDLQKQMGEMAVSRAKEKYAWNVVIKKIDNLYKEL